MCTSTDDTAIRNSINRLLRARRTVERLNPLLILYVHHTAACRLINTAAVVRLDYHKASTCRKYRQQVFRGFSVGRKWCTNGVIYHAARVRVPCSSLLPKAAKNAVHQSEFSILQNFNPFMYEYDDVRTAVHLPGRWVGAELLP